MNATRRKVNVDPVKGMTIKQADLFEFHEALDAYKRALRGKSKRVIMEASVRIHRAKAGVPKRWHSLVGKARKGANQ